MLEFNPGQLALLQDGAIEGAWWHEIENERIECVLCPRRCSLKSGDRGFCFVRENRDGKMVLSTYGKSTGFCIDPIEKKPLNHFFPGSAVLSFGTAGCNLGCKFCQNWDISKSREVARLSSSAGPETIAQAARALDCTSVAFTYNDPVIWAEYAIDVARACHDHGIKTVAVTAGYISDEARADFFRDMDAANVDLKAFSEDFYHKITYSHLQPVLDTLVYLKRETEVWFEITNLIIPDANDNPGELRRMCNWILSNLGDDVPVHFTAFHPDFRMKDRSATRPETLQLAYDIARSEGLQYVYVGNVNDVDRQSTYCHRCGQLLIERNWYQLSKYSIQSASPSPLDLAKNVDQPEHNDQPDYKGHCAYCAATIPGRFSGKCGDWGAKRQPIRIEQFAVPEKQLHSLEPTSATKSTTDFTSELIQLSSKDPDMTGSTSSSSSTPTTTTASAPNVQLNLKSLTQPQRSALLQLAAQTVAGTVCKLPTPNSQLVLGEISQSVIWGAFVSLKRGKVLRGCCGVLSQPMLMGAAVARAAVRTAKEDQRMAPISPVELPYLSIDVTLLGPFKQMTVPPANRAKQVQIGKHGVMIQLGDKSGLLLPSVATENDWDATQFLQAVSRKATLPMSAWENPNAIVSTFDGESIAGEMSAALGDMVVPSETPSPLTPEQLRGYSQLAGANIAAITSGMTPTYYAPNLPDLTANAIVLSMQWGTEQKQQANAMQVSFRPGVPLQATLFQMCQNAAQMLHQLRYAGELQVGITVGIDPCMHGNGKKADLTGVDSKLRAVVLSDPRHCAIAFDPSQSPEELLNVLRVSMPVGSREDPVHTLRVMSTMPAVITVSTPPALTTAGIRPPAVAGKFYPAEDAARRELVNTICKAPAPPQSSPLAIMVPHAGLKYSGHIAAQVWRSVENLDGRTLLIISPKHTNVGVNWSVSPCEQWRLSAGTSFASDTELSAKLAQSVSALQLDAAAHQHEHGIEVQLPLLEKIAPHSKLVGVAVHGGSWEDIQQAAKELADVIRDMPQPPLLVISSDMNHYASDIENRRRDRKALDAMATCDPEQLLTTCYEHDISMCGVVPAALVMETLRQLGHTFAVEEVDYGTSGDVSGDRMQVVGYAGVLLSPK